MPEAEAWVAIAFVIFLGLLIYLGAHRRVIDGLMRGKHASSSKFRRSGAAAPGGPGRAGGIRAQRREAGGEAAAIIASAKGQAGRIAAEAKTRMEDFVVRRTKYGGGQDRPG